MNIKSIYVYCIQIVYLAFFFSLEKTINRILSYGFLYFYFTNVKNLQYEIGLSVHNFHLNLCGQVENSKWILCSRKTGVKSANLRFLMYI